MIWLCVSSNTCSVMLSTQTWSLAVLTLQQRDVYATCAISVLCSVSVRQSDERIRVSIWGANASQSQSQSGPKVSHENHIKMLSVHNLVSIASSSSMLVDVARSSSASNLLRLAEACVCVCECVCCTYMHFVAVSLWLNTSSHTHTHICSGGVCVRVFALLQALAKCALCWRHCQHAEDIFAFFGSVSATWLGRAPAAEKNVRQKRIRARRSPSPCPSLSLCVVSDFAT